MFLHFGVYIYLSVCVGRANEVFSRGGLSRVVQQSFHVAALSRSVSLSGRKSEEEEEEREGQVAAGVRREG